MVNVNLSHAIGDYVPLGGGTMTGALTIVDDVLLKLGTDSDQVALNRSTVLNANTALTGVLIGTPVTPALAANSLIIANVTADGDILIAGNDGGHSRVALFFDASAPNTILYNVGGTWSAGATALTLPAHTSGVITFTGSLIGPNGAWQIYAGGTSGDFNIYGGGIAAAGAGARIELLGNAVATGGFYVMTPNTAKTVDTLRLTVSGNADTAAATWANITHTGLDITSGQVLKVAGTQVVAARVVDERADDVVDNTWDSVDAGVLDALRDAMITHGLIAAA